MVTTTDTRTKLVADMTRFALIFLFMLACGFDTLAQKEALPGVWRGKVESINGSTNEIRLSPMSGKSTETFTGTLSEKAQVRMLDDSIKDLSISDVPLGMYVRVFYDTKNERVSGQHVKVNRVKGILLLGRDLFDKLRVVMNLPPATVFRLSLSDSVPAANPLKLYVFVQPPRSAAGLVKWVGKWNKESGNTYGLIELVQDIGEADLSVLVHNREVETRGSYPDDWMIFPSASAFLAARKDGAFEVLWKYEPWLSPTDSPNFMRVIAKHLEERITARGKH